MIFESLGDRYFYKVQIIQKCGEIFEKDLVLIPAQSRLSK